MTISRSEVNHYGYRGIGYIVEDPFDGSAGYLIDGGLAGGSAEGPMSVYPLPTLTVTPVMGILLGSAMRDLGAKFMLGVNGQILGFGFFQHATAVPAPSPAPAPDPRLVPLFMVILMITQGISEAYERKFPTVPPVLLHKYSKRDQASVNYNSKTIRSTAPGGTYNEKIM